MAEPLRFQITRTRGDYVAGYRTFIIRGRIVLGFWILLGLFNALLILARTSLVIEGEYTGFAHWLDLATPVSVFLVFTAFMFLIMPFRSAHARRDTGLGCDVFADENGITESNSRGWVKVGWDFFSETREIPAMFLLYRGRVGLWIYPKRSLSAGTAGRLRELLRAHIRKTKLRKPDPETDESLETKMAEEPVAPVPTFGFNGDDPRIASSKSLRFRMTSTAKNIVRGYRAHLWRSNVVRVMLLFIIIVMAKSLYGSVSEMISGLGIGSLLHDVVFYGVLIFLIYFVVPAWVVRTATGLGEEYQISVDDEGIEAIGSLISSRTRWENFTAAFETNEGFLLYEGSACFRMYPKHLLDPEQTERFRELIRANVPKVKLRDQSS